MKRPRSGSYTRNQLRVDRLTRGLADIENEIPTADLIAASRLVGIGTLNLDEHLIDML